MITIYKDSDSWYQWRDTGYSATQPTAGLHLKISNKDFTSLVIYNTLLK